MPKESMPNSRVGVPANNERARRATSSTKSGVFRPSLELHAHDLRESETLPP
jgi:hypothetical protein